MHERENALKEWLAQTIQQKDFVLLPLAGDASFRRYFRIQYNGLTQVVMDAPPEKEILNLSSISLTFLIKLKYQSPIFWQ